MTSNRNNRTDEDAVLDAARDCVLAVGVRRTTLTDIARRAGVSRMTLYRRWPDVRTIVADLMTREWTALPVEMPAGADARTRLVAALVDGVATFRAHPLLRKILEVDPELLLPYVLDRLGATQRRFLELFEAAIRAGHDDGSIRPGDAARQARALLLVVQSFALSGPAATRDAELPADGLDDELRRVLDGALAP
ncbi:Bacterial regulatory protein, tetR family [Actinomadura rubteroloni]|uniref:Bacterial regulatory protein, tetR family n=1 Tax=Actinomadura rubteroloni TaxID=1926885 RepID=A0A2P4UDF2_9ACTN|nr:TetR/AcrR family transcriptional regulator [Actinomadura rubteroloni]POM23061.1 Bacterial regulatory protein, tetR family [Actinomadura rubteroloni]